MKSLWQQCLKCMSGLYQQWLHTHATVRVLVVVVGLPLILFWISAQEVGIGGPSFNPDYLFLAAITLLLGRGIGAGALGVVFVVDLLIRAGRMFEFAAPALLETAPDLFLLDPTVVGLILVGSLSIGLILFGLSFVALEDISPQPRSAGVLVLLGGILLLGSGLDDWEWGKDFY